MARAKLLCSRSQPSLHHHDALWTPRRLRSLFAPRGEAGRFLVGWAHFSKRQQDVSLTSQASSHVTRGNGTHGTLGHSETRTGCAARSRQGSAHVRANIGALLDVNDPRHYGHAVEVSKIS